MPHSFLDHDFACWAPDGQLFRIDFAVPVLEEICALAVEGLARFRHGGMEVGGVLYGDVEGEVSRILAFRPLECEHAFGPRFVLSERDRMRLRELVSAPGRDRELAGLAPVGWYHSHTRSEIALSPRDLEVYDSFFPQRWQVALVIRPDDDGPVRAGFFFREPDAVVRTDASYIEFSVLPRYHGLLAPAAEEQAEADEPEALAPELPAEAAPKRPAAPVVVPEPAPEADAMPAPPVPAPAEPARSAPLELPRFAQVQARPPRRGLWVVLALVLAGVSGFGVQRYYSLAAPPQSLSLWVADMGGQLLIEWDRGAEPIRNASEGILDIQDGAERSQQRLDGERLREGSVDYVRRSDIVDVRLRVRAGGSSTAESIRFVGPPVRRDAGADADLARQRDELKAQVEKLQQQVQQRDALVGRLRAMLRAH